MKRVILSAAAAVFMGALPLTAADAAKPELLYPEAVTLHLGFDGTVDASFAKGRAKPIQTHGKVNFLPGLRGKALLCGQGGAMLLYMRNKNVDFTKPGTMLFFYKPVDWEKMKFKGGVFFSGIQAKKGALYFNIAHDPVKVCPCRRPVTLHLFNGVKLPNQMYVYYPKFDQKKCAEWHMLAFSWEPGKLQISQDGKAWRSYPVAFSFTAADFPNPAICVGSPSRWNYLMDEFTVYNRVLSADELAAVYKKFKK